MALSFPGGLPEIKEWSSKCNVSITLYNVGPAEASVSPESRPRLKIVCREFHATPDIRSSKSWTKGTDKIDIHLPNFAMTHRQRLETAKNLDAMLEREYDKLVDELAADSEEIVSRTLTEAKRQADKVGNSTMKQMGVFS